MIISKIFNEVEIQWIKDNCPNLSRKDLTAQFNQTFSQDKKVTQLVAFIKNHNIKSGRTGYFKKGVPSWSKGTKGILKANSGSFQKGGLPHNHLPVGSERVVSWGGVEVKVEDPNKWICKGRLTWEEHNGPIPPKHNIRYRDGNPLNCEDITNLFLVSKSEHQHLSIMKFKEQPEEVKDTVILLARVHSKTNSLKNGESHASS